MYNYIENVPSDVTRCLSDFMHRLEAWVNTNAPGKRLRRECIRLHSFPQSWPSSALGHPGMGCAAITEDQTYIFSYGYGPGHSAVWVYQGRYSYQIDKPNKQFWEDVKNWKVRGEADFINDPDYYTQ